MIGSRLRSRGGFTLVETMVALVMLAIVIGAIYGTYRTATSTASVAEERADLNQTARILLSQINRELCSAYQPAQTTGSQASSLEGEDTEGGPTALQHDKISFLTTAESTIPVKGPAGDLRRVTYSLETDTHGEPVAFAVQVDPRPELSMSDEAPDPIELSTLVVGFNCRYLDGDTDEWEDEWLQREKLPAAVRVELWLKPNREGAKPVLFASTANTTNLLGPGSEQSVQEESFAE